MPFQSRNKESHQEDEEEEPANPLDSSDAEDEVAMAAIGQSDNGNTVRNNHPIPMQISENQFMGNGLLELCQKFPETDIKSAAELKSTFNTAKDRMSSIAGNENELVLQRKLQDQFDVDSICGLRQYRPESLDITS